MKLVKVTINGKPFTKSNIRDFIKSGMIEVAKNNIINSVKPFNQEMDSEGASITVDFNDDVSNMKIEFHDMSGNLEEKIRAAISAGL